MKTEEYVSAIKNMQAFSDLVGSIYPDQYKFVCQQHDIPEREAMDICYSARYPQPSDIA